jgi:hypothetical protein
MDIAIRPIDDETGARLRADIEAGTVPAEERVGAGMPCRQCLRLSEHGETMHLLTYQPFTGSSPYAVPSPVFLHAEPCRAHEPTSVPAFVRTGGLRTVRSYDERHAIVDGAVVEGADVERAIADLLADDRAAYVHAHCAVNGCFTFRAERAA